MKQYKTVKKAGPKNGSSRVNNQNDLFNKINSDLALIMGDDSGLGAAKGSARAFSASEREKRKEEIEKWKKEKEKRKQAQMAQTNDEQNRIKEALKRRQDSNRRETKEQIEEFKFRKEMDK